MAITGGDVESVSSSSDRSSRAGSPPATTRNQVKFMCHHGGKITSRPSDGRLKYVEGETRVVYVPRDITFHELMKKLTSIWNGDLILKYQVIPEDLDVLVTVKSDEDVRHMVEECDRHDLLSVSPLRAFLFRSNPIVTRNQIQRYITSINGVDIHPLPTYNTFAPVSVNTSYTTTFTDSTVCSTTRVPPETTTTTTTTTATTCSTTVPEVPHFHGSPSVPNLGPSNHQNPVNNQNPVNHQPPPHVHHHQPPKPPLDHHLHKASGSDEN